jgi:hypothetical protein
MPGAALLLAFAAVTASPSIVTSADPTDLAVTVYRDPNRSSGGIDPAWPPGYALVSETRSIRVPAGESVIRFEGVSEGLMPETAIVAGLPNGVREKNRDARLISPAGLVDAYLKRSVTLRRTNPKTGQVREQQAIIQAGPDGGVVLQTSEGVEALGCWGLPERMLFGGMPEGLSSKPTLSVLTTSDREVVATVRLTYLAQGFDWSANYVAELAEDQKSLSLFAWLTVANGGAQGFPDANLQVVAGQPNKERARASIAPADPQLHLRCWPMDITSTHSRWGMAALPPPPPPAAMATEGFEDIVVTAQKRTGGIMSAPVAISAVQEELGDLKLYRVPVRVTVAAQSQKQVAMLNQPEARFDRVYVGNVQEGDSMPRPMQIVLRSRNVKEKGLGLPLPAGGLTLFEPVGARSVLAGEDAVSDRAIGEEVEIRVGDSPQVTWALHRVNERDQRQQWRVDISNAHDRPVRAEILVPYELSDKPKGIERGKGGWLIKAEVPANGTAQLHYSLKLSAGEVAR